MKKIRIKVLRYNPENGVEKEFSTYEVDKDENSTILEGLQQIYERNDSTLAFNYGCRVKNCGLCAVNADGKPYYACITKIKDSMEITPLNNLPLIKDLIFDREQFFNFLKTFKPYVIRDKPPETLPETLIQPPEHAQLMSCRECFACMSSCPEYKWEDESFGGPLGFVKLAQLHYDCRDSQDRVSQARDMGILKCTECKKCVCISGIPINKIVIQPFLETLNAR
ncbi:MAG: 2Fe-2S iron-sulfur cluster-binding protein [Thermodesulfobacteriota bacterium]|nr:2Fe-2S iron-sulfur cluster-binding protein [Thermodesulfobacteriota bacterium]